MAGKRIAVFSLLALAGLALALFATSGTHAQTYKPTFGYSVADPTGGATSTTTNVIEIPAPDYNYEDSSLYTFTPIDGWSEAGTAIAIADEVGTLSAQVYVGLLGGPCSTNLPPSFTLENASVNTSVVIPPGSSADPPGTNNMYWVLKPAATYTVPVAAYDPFFPDYLEAMPHFINDMLDPDGAGPDPPLQPQARYAGYTTVAGMNIIIQFIVLDPGQITQLGGIKAQMGAELGQPSLVILDNPVSQEESPGAISDFCTPLSTTTTLLGTTLANQYTLTGGGTVARTNPPIDTGVLDTGTHMARNYSQSERDADGDGIENDLDPCHFTAEPLWDPRGVTAIQPGLDTDGDGLPDSCDPTPAISNIDEDADGYNNRQDVCPLVPNGCIVASCSAVFPPLYNAAWDNMADDDGDQPNADVGPGPDSIGNACDDSDCDGVEDGAVTPCSCADGIDNGPDGTTDGNDPDCIPYMDKGELLAATEPWGAQPGTGQFSHAMPWTAMALTNDAGTDDTDGDGYSDALEAALGSCADDTLPTPGTCATQGYPGATNPEDSVPESLVIDFPLTVGAGAPPRSGVFPPADLNVPQSCSDGADNDGDTLTDALDNTDLGCDPADDSYDGDDDHDGVVDDGGTDNCGKAGTTSTWNPEQTNSDGDTIGNACDNCPTTDNEGQEDTGDGDGVGDACDNCPDDANPGQENSDGDSDGDACDVCTNDPNDDADSDGICAGSGYFSPKTGDNDNCPDDANPGQEDNDDGDGAGDACDNCPATANVDQNDVDDDGDGDACDNDDNDSDGYSDAIEWYLPTNPGEDCTEHPGHLFYDAWPMDIDISRDISVTGDVFNYVGKIGATPGAPNWVQRLDLDVSSDISVTGDVFQFVGKIGQTCTWP